MSKAYEGQDLNKIAQQAEQDLNSYAAKTGHDLNLSSNHGKGASVSSMQRSFPVIPPDDVLSTNANTNY